MVRRNQFLVLAAGAMMAFAVGCGGGSGTTDSGPGNDAGGTTDAGGMDGTSGGSDSGTTAEAGAPRTLTYVIDQLNVDDPNMAPDYPNKFSGFNVDGLASADVDSDGCNVQDLYPLYDNDQLSPANCTPGDTGCLPAVDNQLPQIASTIMTAAGTDVRQQLADQVSSNSLALLVRVTDVNDLQNDSSVGLYLYIGYPKFTDNCSSVQPGRHYDVSQGSLNSATGTIDDARFHFTGSIVNGRLQVNMGMGSTFQLPLPPIMGQTINLALHSTQLRMDLTETVGDRGNLGGWVLAQEIVDAVTALAPQYATVVQGAIGGLVDVRVNPTTHEVDTVNGICNQAGTDGGPRQFGGISLGLGIHAVNAIIDGVAATASQPAGTCGASTSGDGGTGDGG